VTLTLKVVKVMLNQYAPMPGQKGQMSYLVMKFQKGNL